MKVSFSPNKKNDATIENNVRLPYSAGKRVFPKIRWVLILLLVSSPFILFAGKIVLDWAFVTSPGMLWMEKKTINSIEPGIVDKVYFHRGEEAAPAAPILKVKRRIPEGRLEQIALLEAERDAANGSYQTAAPVRGNADAAYLGQQSVAYYQNLRDNTKWLLQQGAATQAEMNAAENRLSEVKAGMAAATAVNGTAGSTAVNPARIAQIEQSIKSLKQMTEEYFTVNTGAGGKVSSVFVTEGQSFAAGEPLAVLVDTQKVYIVTYVDPGDFKNITLGTVANVKLPGSGRQIKAVVEQPPVSADNVPTGISEKMYSANMRGVQIYLKTQEPLKPEELIEGLPVTVKW
ncbi:MAG: multidrug resistance efflux pump-like protein [Firmicutes bacterium]|nr:multidrug resistance efflux pump-like protein [Bacillota bacterium]